MNPRKQLASDALFMRILSSWVFWLFFVGLTVAIGSFYGLSDIGAPSGQKQPNEPTPDETRRRVAEEQAKLPPSGWSVTEKQGVFWRWCEQGECETGKSRGGRTKGLEVWCRDSACPYIYAKVNIIDASGRVIDWTNDSGGGRQGDKIILEMTTFTEANPIQGDLVELSIQ